MNCIALSAGHNPQSKGASHNGFNEYDEAVLWVSLLKELLVKHGFEVLLVPTGSLTSKIKFVNTVGKAKKVKLALEVHFNSSGRKASGSETLYCPGSEKGFVIAGEIQRSMASLMPPNRGIKEGWYKQDKPGVVDYPGDIDGDESLVAFLEKTFCPAIIIEPEFIQNKTKIVTNRTACCDLLADVIIEYFS